MQNYFVTLLALTHIVLAGPIQTSSYKTSASARDLVENISAMQFNGPIVPGGANVTLSGTAEDIYKQILILNPAYDVFDFPEAAKKLDEVGVTRDNIDTGISSKVSTTKAMAARDVLKRQDGIDCSIRHKAFAPNCNEGVGYLRRLGTASCSVYPYDCARVSCSWNCGMYLCSKGGFITVHCQDIANDIEAIRDKCTQGVQVAGRRAFYNHNIELGSDRC